ncbi:MAG: class I tRNA ligase family protein, partial [Nanoarchaeota archaeon]|nr:class I tRNA ligase family protein [Nanoarchaeota archaeon]
PWASLGYPFQNKDLFEKLWPIDLIDESVDQIRGWFYTLMVCSQATFNKPPYKTVCMNGWTLDEKGEKMSKSLGNVVWAEDAYNKIGADLLRLYYCYDNPPWETHKFGYRKAEDIGKSLNVLWNTYLFINTYAKKAEIPKYLKIEDKWILSRINTVIHEMTEYLEKFEFHRGGRLIVDFILNDFSRWYIKIIRDRVSPTYKGEDKKTAGAVLMYVLEKAVRLLAPISPFITEKIYQEAFGGKSVHMSSWPESEKKYVDTKLEEHMSAVKNVIEIAGALRQDKRIKLRWPVSELIVSGEKLEDAVKTLEPVINTMANVKSTKFSKKIVGGKTEGGITVDFGKVLMDEALLRELVRNVQEVRKKSKFNVHDSISLFIKSDKETEKVLKGFEDRIKQGVGAKTVVMGQIKHQKGKLEFEKKIVDFGFEKV